MAVVLIDWVPIGVCATCSASEYRLDHKHGCPRSRRSTRVKQIVITLLLAALSGIAIGMLAVLPGFGL